MGTIPLVFRTGAKSKAGTSCLSAASVREIHTDMPLQWKDGVGFTMQVISSACFSAMMPIRLVKISTLLGEKKINRLIGYGY